MQVIETEIPEVKLLVPEKHGDHRGFFSEVYSRRVLKDGGIDVEFVQENGPEIVEEKIAIFAELDRLAPPDALLVSSTSAITASRFTEMLPGRARCLIGHPVNPPHLIPLVELCGAPWTAPDAVERARKIYREIGQVPVRGANGHTNGYGPDTGMSGGTSAGSVLLRAHLKLRCSYPQFVALLDDFAHGSRLISADRLSLDARSGAGMTAELWVSRLILKQPKPAR